MGKIRSCSARLFLALLSCFPVLGAGGCRRPSSDPSEENAGAQGSPEKPTETSRSDPDSEAEKEFKDLKARLQVSKETAGRKIAMVQIFLQNMKQREAKAGRPFAVTSRAERELKSLEQSLDGEAEAEYGKLEEKVKPLLEGESLDYNAASALVDEFPAKKYEKSAVIPKLEELKARIFRYSSAEMEFELRKSWLRDDPVQNIALLEGFPPQFDDTPFFGKVQELIKENYKKYAETRQSVQDTAKNLVWEDLDVNSYRPQWPEEAPAEVKGDALTIGPNRSSYEEKDTAGTCVTLGSDNWIDVEIHLEAQIVQCEKVSFGARGHFGAGDVFTFAWKNLGELEIKGDDWHQIIVKIDGRKMEIVDVTGKKSTLAEGLRMVAGPFGIRVTGDEASIKIRKVQYAVKTKEASEETPGEDEKGGKKKSKKASKKPDDGPDGS